MILNFLPGASILLVLAALGDSSGLKEEHMIFWNVMRIRIGTGQQKSVDITIGSVLPAITKCDLWHVRYGWDILVFQNEQMGELKKKISSRRVKHLLLIWGKYWNCGYKEIYTFLFFILLSWLEFCSKNTWIGPKDLQNVFSNTGFTIAMK